MLVVETMVVETMGGRLGSGSVFLPKSLTFAFMVINFDCCQYIELMGRKMLAKQFSKKMVFRFRNV